MESMAKSKVNLFLAFAAMSLLSIGANAFAQTDSSRVSSIDSSAYNPKAMAEGQKWFGNHVGADLFVTGEAYTFHFGRVGFLSLTGEGGVGAELRFKPLFAGFVYGLSGSEMRDRPSGPFSCSSFYVGVIVSGYRAEVGEVYGSFLAADQDMPDVSFKTYFAGLSRRFGGNAFLEPEIQIMFPVEAGTYVNAPPGNSYTNVSIEHYTMGDLFFCFSVKLGLGVGYCR